MYALSHTQRVHAARIPTASPVSTWAMSTLRCETLMSCTLWLRPPPNRGVGGGNINHSCGSRLKMHMQMRVQQLFGIGSVEEVRQQRQGMQLQKQRHATAARLVNMPANATRKPWPHSNEDDGDRIQNVHTDFDVHGEAAMWATAEKDNMKLRKPKETAQNSVPKRERHWKSPSQVTAIPKRSPIMPTDCSTAAHSKLSLVWQHADTDIAVTECQATHTSPGLA